MIIQYEYVGFHFEIMVDETGKPVNAKAMPGQHAAAYKDKHRRNAMECYAQDNGIEL
jgi:hypothetical protein